MLSLLENVHSWPTWTLNVFGLLLLIFCCLHLFAKKEPQEHVPEPPSFLQFQHQYLRVYYLIMFADWMQGTHMYTLYSLYQVDVGTLFLTGFLASACIGTFIGTIVDRMGRQKACLLYCALEVLINLLEHSPRFPVLLVGRVLGGISTSLLFSAFESWMVTEHHKRQFDEKLLAKTFAKASVGNGLMAILAGIVAQLAADRLGEIGPFQIAVVLTIIAGVLVAQWPENYGDKPSKEQEPGILMTIAEIRQDPKLWALGFGYSCFEGAMFTFVFLWVPTMMSVVPKEELPTGIIFSSFMLCIAIGGKLFLLAGAEIREEILAICICALSSLALLIPALCRRFEAILASFLLFEVCVGLFEPCSAICRSRNISDGKMGATLTLFRLPLNTLVVIGTYLNENYPRNFVFYFCSGCLVIATLCQVVLLRSTRLKEKNSKKKSS